MNEGGSYVGSYICTCICFVKGRSLSLSRGAAFNSPSVLRQITHRSSRVAFILHFSLLKRERDKRHWITLVGFDYKTQESIRSQAAMTEQQEGSEYNNMEERSFLGKGRFTTTDEAAKIAGNVRWWTCQDHHGRSVDLEALEGTFPKGKPIFLWENQDMYVGEWTTLDDGTIDRHGFGCYISFGEVYVGDWDEGVMDGQGKLFWLPNVEVWQFDILPGSPIDDLKTGKDIPFIYEGAFEDNMKHGLATVEIKSGMRRRGMWEEDELVGDFYDDHVEVTDEEKSSKKLPQVETPKTVVEALDSGTAESSQSSSTNPEEEASRIDPFAKNFSQLDIVNSIFKNHRKETTDEDKTKSKENGDAGDDKMDIEDRDDPNKMHSD